MSFFDAFWQNCSVCAGMLPFVVMDIVCAVEFKNQISAISNKSCLMKGSPPVNATFRKQFPDVKDNFSISSSESSSFPSLKSTKQCGQRALHRSVTK